MKTHLWIITLEALTLCALITLAPQSHAGPLTHWVSMAQIREDSRDEQFTDLREHLEEHPENDGLRHLLEAIEAYYEIDPEALYIDATRTFFWDVFRDGWPGEKDSLLLENILDESMPIICSARAALNAEHLSLPELDARSFAATRFSISIDLILDLMQLESMRLARDSEYAAAAEMALDIGRLTRRIQDSGPMTQSIHMMCVKGYRSSVHALVPVLRSFYLTWDIVERIEAELTEWDENFEGTHAQIQAELDHMVERFQTVSGDEEERREVRSRHSAEIIQEQFEIAHAEWARFSQSGVGACRPPGEGDDSSNPFREPDLEEALQYADEKWQLIELTLSDLPSLESETARLRERIAENFERSIRDRDFLDSEWIQQGTDHPWLGQINFSNLREFDVIDNRVIAKMRLCRALCAWVMGNGEQVNDLIDPFSGEPLRNHYGAHHSVGPDFESQDARTIYDPTNGTWSTGDIVLPSPPTPEGLNSGFYF